MEYTRGGVIIDSVVERNFVATRGTISRDLGKIFTILDRILEVWYTARNNELA